MDVKDRTEARRLRDLIRTFRLRTGLTQLQLAERAQISAAAVRDLEQGRVTEPRPRTLRALADAMSLSEVETGRLLQARARAGALQMRVLGPLVVLHDDRSISLGSTKQRILLGALALSPNAPVQRDTLIDVLWEGEKPSDAVDILQTHISRLRRKLQPDTRSADVLVSVHESYQLDLDEDQLDLLSMRKLVRAARQAHDAGDITHAYRKYGQAAQLWRSTPVSDIPELATYPPIAALQLERQALILNYAQVALQVGDHEAVIPHLQQLIQAEPMNEAAHARLMIALAENGDRTAALALFDGMSHRLADELGADPGPELIDAHRRVLTQVIPESAGAPVSAHRQLPADITDFVGRETEQRLLFDQIAAADSVRTGSNAIVISAIEGMAGVGKTRLAVHVAHQLSAAGRFDDIHLYVDLRGHAPDPPADPADVLSMFLRLLGVPGDRVPADLGGRAALYRDRLNGKQALVLLDNAADINQVLPLLPGSSGNLVLITSRRTLALDGAIILALDVFTSQEGQRLLARIAGHRRVPADSTETRRVVKLCGHLPLAIALAARRLQGQSTWTLSDLSSRLESARGRHDGLAIGSEQVRAAFDLSYNALEPEVRRVFRMLGLHPGGTFTAESTAALIDLPLTTTRRVLDQLVDEHLLVAITSDQYRMHSLVHEYSVQHARHHGHVDQDVAAIERLIRWYLYSADAALGTIGKPTIVLDPDKYPDSALSFVSNAEACAWLDAEHANLVAAVDLALERRLFDLCIELPSVLGQYFEDGHQWHALAKVCRTGLVAARKCGDRPGETRMLSLLGLAMGALGDFEQSISCLEASLDGYRNAGDRSGEATSLNNLGRVYGRQGRFATAIECFRAAQRIGWELGERELERMSLCCLGKALVKNGDYEEAAVWLERARRLAECLGNETGLATALSILGSAQSAAQRHDKAIGCLEQAIEIFRRSKATGREADAQLELGNVFEAAGDRRRAHAHWREALRLQPLVHSRYTF